MKTCFKLKYPKGTVLEFKHALDGSPCKYFHILECLEDEYVYKVEMMGERGDYSGVEKFAAGYIESTIFSVCTIKTMRSRKSGKA